MYLLLFNILIPMCMCSTEFCVYKNANNEYAYCAEDATNRTLDFIPRVTTNITTINMYGQPLGQLVYNAFQNVTNARFILNIELLFCQISYVNVEAFLNLDNLSDLILSFNDIHGVDSKTFQHVKHVKNIYMASNNIEILRKGLFANLPQLQGVHLGYNNIRTIEPGTFANSPSLQYIVLSNNQLQHLDISFLDRSSTLTSLYLHENPWICDSNLKELFSFYAKLAGNVQLTYIPECVYNQESRRYYWNELFSHSYLEILEPANGTILLNKGSKITLVCKVFAFPKPDVKWQKGSTIVDSSSFTTYAGNNTYYLNYTFTVEQYASYHCVVSNTNLTKRAHVTIYLSYIEAIKSSIVISFYMLGALVLIILACFIIYFTWKRTKDDQDRTEDDNVRGNLLISNCEAETSENPRNRQENIEMIDLLVNN